MIRTKTHARQRTWLFYMLCVFFSLVMSAAPLPEVLMWWRPEWVLLVMLYWIVVPKEPIGLGTAWLMGLLLDGVRGALLGQNAMALTLVAYLALQSRRRFNLFPLGQQALSVILMVLLADLIVLWLQGLVSEINLDWRYLLPAFTSGLFWPVIYLLLNKVKQQLNLVDL